MHVGITGKFASKQNFEIPTLFGGVLVADLPPAPTQKIVMVNRGKDI